MWVILALGSIAGLDFLQSIINGGNKVAACNYYIDFGVHSSNQLTGAFYFIATCVVVLMSSHGAMQWWGVANLIAVSALAVERSQGLPSLWCFWAAATSWFVAWLMRSLKTSTKVSVETV